MKRNGKALVALGLTLMLQVPALKTQTGNASAPCARHECSKGWHPKRQMPMTASASDVLCCDKTCELWTCEHGFVENSAYYGNVGQTNAKCCDKICSNGITCPDGFAIRNADKNKPGLNSSDCCTETCANAVCPPPWANPPAGSDKTKKFSTDPTDCCEATCGSHDCPDGKLHLKEKLRDIAASAEAGKCCADSCEDYCCPNGYEKGPNASSTLKGDDPTASCCVLKCGDEDSKFGYKCSKGWHPIGDLRSCATQPCTDRQCCIKTCGIYNCPDDYVKNKDSAALWPATDDTCCLGTCKLVDCPEEFYVVGSNMNRSGDVGSSPAECCEKKCSLHTCAGDESVLIPNASSVAGSDDATCCEPALCKVFRGLKQTSVPGCNTDGGRELTGDECEQYYTELVHKQTNETDSIRCVWDKGFELCRVGGTDVTGMLKPKTCMPR
eukprot:TRINITY_DN36774_c0_g1_i1.p1 TRINITY_DN36774_c0_g1~~TRINITY_DN36774_c0_g1_i1.p1  ORF type:complete len:440 (+),score=81.27 TRINITY_DN36774_c0_g1_i1:90-1409(+)